jgi:hypothetical protein
MGRNYAVTFYFKKSQVFVTVEIKAFSGEEAEEKAALYLDPGTPRSSHSVSLLPR